MEKYNLKKTLKYGPIFDGLLEYVVSSFVKCEVLLSDKTLFQQQIYQFWNDQYCDGKQKHKQSDVF